jgi:glycosyltransferase involved in cell wall biosynthesis
MSKRVLLVARILDSSGVTTHMLTLAKGLKSMGWEVAVASGGQSGNHSYGPECFESNGIPHHYIPFPNASLSFQNLLNFVKSLLGVNRLARQFRPDVIHIKWISTSPYIRMIQLIYKIPFVTTLHIEGIPCGLVYRLGTFWGDRSIAISNETRDYLINKFGVPSSKIEIIYNGVDESYFCPPTLEQSIEARRAFNLETTSKVVCLLGRLEPVKGHDILIKSLMSLRSQGCDVIALFAGEGSQKEALKKLALECGVADLIHFIGYRDPKHVLWASDVSVLPSRTEGFGIVVAESMLCGVVPIRTPAAGAYEQIQDGVNGFIVPFDDYEALAKRLQQLLYNQEQKDKMSKATLITANQKFTQKIMIEKILSVYQEVT